MTARRPRRLARRPGRTSALRVRVARSVVVGAVLTIVVACSAQPATTPVDPDPRVVGQPAPAAEVAQWALPLSWDGAPVVDPGWDLRPQEMDGLFLGVDVPTTAGDPLRYVAVDSHGTIMWTAERPPSCTGFTLSRAGGAPVAVLTDLTARGTTTASAYDLRSGQRLWGPADVRGAYQGPGLVFAEPAAALGETGPRVALDPATGAVVTDEAEQEGLAVVGEFGGVVLSARDDTLQAVDAGSRAPLWSLRNEHVGIPVGAVPVAVAGTEPPDGTALLTGRGPDGTRSAGALVGLDGGVVVTTDVRQAVQDPATGVLVVAGSSDLRALRDGEVLWSSDLPASATVSSAGGVLVYVRDGESLAIRNVLTGAQAVAYEPHSTTGFAVPVIVSGSGAAVVRTDTYMLLTTPP